MLGGIHLHHFIFLAFLFLGLEGLVERRREEGRAEGLAGLGIVRFLFFVKGGGLCISMYLYVI